MSIKNRQFLLLGIVTIGAGLRLLYLDKYPTSLYSDEVSQGYNAYSILVTGRDEHRSFLPVSFRSFGDWKPPLPTYFMVPTIALFGLNAWGVRLPSAFLGSLTVVLAYFLASEIISYFGGKQTINSFTKHRQAISLWTALLISISPWHILQSRTAMLVVVASFFIYLGLWAFFRGLKYPNYWYLTGLSFTLAIYSYYGMRVIVPLLLVYLLFKFTKQLVLQSRIVLTASLLILALLLPLGLAFFRQPNVILGRAKTVSVFYDRGVDLSVRDLIVQDGLSLPLWVTQIFHSQPYLYTVDILRRFFQHFDGRFLFLVGDKHPPFQIPGMGVLYITDGILLLTGVIYLIKKSVELLKFLITLIFISILPAALTFLTPSANRTFTVVLPMMVVVAVGAVTLIDKFSRIKAFIVLIVAYFLSFAYFAHQYIRILLTQHADWWHYGYKELITYITDEESKYESVAISGQASVPYIFLLFFTKADPELVQTTLERDLNDDEFGFEHVTAIGKYQFPRYFNWKVDGENLPSKSLLVVAAKEEVGESAHEIKRILYPNSETAYKIYKIE